ncbi:MAG: AMIN domain-containing protein [Desulfuromonadaceae bacterium]
MKKTLSAVLFLAMLGCMHSAVLAAELLDVKPVIAGSTVSVEISSDIAMTYTYYKVPGQARAVVDIAEADPEKVEPLIVVNKGAISSISVDKAQISGIVVSRIIFNLVSESDISVTASPDRKLLTVTFGGSAAAEPEPKPVPPLEPVAKVEPPAIAAVIPPAGAVPEEDPLGLDEPAAKPAASLTTPVAAASEVTSPAASTVIRVPKLEPVVPVPASSAPPSALTITGIATGKSYIEIRANRPITDYKTIKLSSPERLVIDIAGAKKQLKSKTFVINKFAISKVRIGEAPDHIRVVIDSGKVAFPANTITNTEDGLRSNFK